MSKHTEAIREALQHATPGPWRHDIDDTIVPDDVTIYAEDQTFVVNVGVVGNEYDGDRCVAFDGSHANARYIAACNPEGIAALLAERDALLDALIDWFFVMEDKVRDDDPHGNWAEKLERARAAIRKAMQA